MSKLLRSLGIATIVLFLIALIPITLFIVIGILMYFGIQYFLALPIGVFVVLFILITIGVYYFHID